MQLAVEVMQHLHRAKGTACKGLGAAELVVRMRIDALQLAPVLETLVAIDWVAPLAEEPDNEDPRYVLLADPAITPVEPLLKELLMPQSPPLESLWRRGPLDALLLQDLLPTR